MTSSPVGSRAVLRSAVASSSRSSLTVREWSVAIDLMMSAVGSAAVCSPATSRSLVASSRSTSVIWPLVILCTMTP